MPSTSNGAEVGTLVRGIEADNFCILDVSATSGLASFSVSIPPHPHQPMSQPAMRVSIFLLCFKKYGSVDVVVDQTSFDSSEDTS